MPLQGTYAALIGGSHCIECMCAVTDDALDDVISITETIEYRGLIIYSDIINLVGFIHPFSELWKH